MTKDPRYYSAKEAAATLSISRATLYAYVSRGMIRSEETDGKTQARRYHAADVEALLARKEQRQNPAKAAAAALHWGDPVLASNLTLIANGRIYYRGHDAINLASSRTFEEVVALLWTGSFQADDLFNDGGAFLNPKPLLLANLSTGLTPIETFQAILPYEAPADLGAYDFSPEGTARTGSRILNLLTVAAAKENGSGRVAQRLQQAWLPDQPEMVPLLDMALILCADHELNVSSFTARCVASARATPYAVVIAGLAALSGSRHGGYTDQVEALFREVGQPKRAQTTIASRLKRGEQIPGFGHKLYPDGDPRAVALLEAVTTACPDADAVKLAHALAKTVVAAIGQQPTVDFALVALAEALGLPPGMALALFALGRTAGWLAHASEQYQQPHLIRPRAKYGGEMPEAVRSEAAADH